MKRQVRKNVFETNSSSTHSLCMSSDDLQSPRLTTTFSDKQIEFVIKVECGEFGWGFEELHSQDEKLSYIATMIQYKDHSVDKIEESRYFEWLAEMIKEETKYDLEYFSKGGYHECGYIDHQSMDTLDCIWTNDKLTFKENMKQLIFSSSSYITIGNDNC